MYRSSDHDPVVVGLEDGLLGPVDLTFLNFNDFHGRIGVPPDTDTVRFAGTIEEQRALAAAAGGYSVLLAAGDSIGASLFNSASAKTSRRSTCSTRSTSTAPRSATTSSTRAGPT